MSTLKVLLHVCVRVCLSYILIKFVTFWIYCLPSIESEVPTLCGIDNSVLSVICLVLFCQLICNASSSESEEL